jgi:hypothetical protein
MFTNLKWSKTGNALYHAAEVLDGLIELQIDVYEPHPTKGNAYQIRIRGIRTESVGRKVWLPSLDHAKNAAVGRLNELALRDLDPGTGPLRLADGWHPANLGDGVEGTEDAYVNVTGFPFSCVRIFRRPNEALEMVPWKDGMEVTSAHIPPELRQQIVQAVKAHDEAK